MTKKEKHNKRIQNRQNILDELLHFGSYMAVNDVEKSVERRGDNISGGKRRKIGKNKKLSKKPRRGGEKGGKKVKLLDNQSFLYLRKKKTFHFFFSKYVSNH